MKAPGLHNASAANRARAARILSVAASNPSDARAVTANNTYDAERSLYGTIQGHPWTVGGELARAALRNVPRRFQGVEAYAYAEALLRCGWQP